MSRPVLAFDTSGPWCAAALTVDGSLKETAVEEMTRGQAERLMPMLEDLLKRNGTGWQDLGRIGVGVGPGNFTGIRISVSAARGLALGLNVPALGVSAFEALAPDSSRPVAVAGPRNTAYVQHNEGAPEILDQGDVPVDAIWLSDPARLAASIARQAEFMDTASPLPPAPLYIRPADAAPAKDAPPVILDDA